MPVELAMSPQRILIGTMIGVFALVIALAAVRYFDLPYQFLLIGLGFFWGFACFIKETDRRKLLRWYVSVR